MHCFSRSILGTASSFDKAAVAVIRTTAPEITIIDRMCIVALRRGEAAALIVSSAFLQLLSNGRIIDTYATIASWTKGQLGGVKVTPVAAGPERTSPDIGHIGILEMTMTARSASMAAMRCRNVSRFSTGIERAACMTILS